MDKEITQVLEFWFGRLDEQGVPTEPMDKLWFGASALSDSAIRQRFGGMHLRANDGQLAHWLDCTEGRLALIILLDQFSRNIYRGSAEAFNWDDIALGLCKSGVEQELDQSLRVAEKLFFYMPLQHSELLSDQFLGIQLLERLMVGLKGPALEMVHNTLRFQQLHLDIIERFGRFPHRNAILGRQNTPEETSYLAEGAPRFGQ